MANGAYKQEKLNLERPFKQSPESETVIELSVSHENRKLHLKMSFQSGDRDIFGTLEKGEDTPKFVKIQKDSKITFTLDDNTDWRWSNDYDGITFKQDLSSLYGKIEYCDEFECDSKSKSDGGIIVQGFKSMSFLAKHDRNGVENTIHGFSLNIDFKQANGTWLPVTFDPDVKNPFTPHT